MAQVNYSEGVQEVAPTPSAPNDYQNIRADANSFGASIGQGLEKFGAGASKAANFFGQAAADDASNQFQDFATKLLHGDPSKSTVGPDGQPVVDTGYMGTKGRATLDSRPNVQSAIDDKLKELRSNLTTPEQQLQFDNFSRKYRTGVIEKIGSHADSQANEWYTSVNTATSKLALDHIAINWDNPVEVRNGAADLTAAYVRNAQVKSGTADLDSVQLQEAAAAAKRDALTAQLNAMAVKDPARAMAVLEKNREIAGVAYDNLANQFRTKAEAQRGDEAANNALKRTYSAPGGTPAVAQRASVAMDYFTSQGWTKEQAAGIVGNLVHESNLDPNTVHDNNTGLGIAGHRLERLDAMKRFAAAKGKPVNDFQTQLEFVNQELSTTEGAAGAAVRAARTPQEAAAAFINFERPQGYDPRNLSAAHGYSNRLAQAVALAGNPMGAISASRKAEATRAILSDPSLNDAEVAHALNRVNMLTAADAVAQEQDAKARAAQRDAFAGHITSQIIKGAGPEVISQIAAAAESGGLSHSEARELYSFATGAGGIEDTLSSGTGYVDAMKRLTLPEGDPNRLYDPMQLVRMRNEGQLTKKGYAEVFKTMNEIKKDPNQAGVTTTKAHQLDYYKNKFGIDQSFMGPGVTPFKNPKGLDIFNHQFVPAFEAAYSEWIAAGKKPMDFLQDTKQMDAIMDRIYPPAQRAADSISADQPVGDGKQVDKTLPPVPDGVDQNQWARFMKDPPKAASGAPYLRDDWAKAINRLRENPTPAVITAFNNKFYLSGYTAQDILKALPVPKKSDNTAPVPGGVPLTGPDDSVGMGIRG